MLTKKVTIECPNCKNNKEVDESLADAYGCSNCNTKMVIVGEKVVTKDIKGKKKKK